MPRKKHRKHTPITSEAQRGLFGAELKRRREGKRPRLPSVTRKELVSHLEEAGGKELPARARRGRRAASPARGPAMAQPL